MLPLRLPKLAWALLIGPTLLLLAGGGFVPKQLSSEENAPLKPFSQAEREPMSQTVTPVSQDVWAQFSRRHYGLDPQKVVYLYIPPSADEERRVPLAILVHGGNYLHGSATDYSMLPLARYFMERGYAVASVEYRWPAPVEDVRDAIGYIFRSVGERIESTTYVGYSAGAVTGALLLYGDQFGHIDGIDRFIGLSGLYDKEATSADPVMAIRQQSLEGIDLLKVIEHIRQPQAEVPALLVEGSRDYFVDRYPHTERSHAECLAALLKQHGIRVQTFWGVDPGYDTHDGPIALFTLREPQFIKTLDAFLAKVI
jgi:acetyl esterase/lipase